MKKFHTDPDINELGIDEAGRGCLAGPVCVAGVVLNPELEIPSDIVIKDSKKMTKRQKDKSVEYIKKYAIAYSTVFVNEKEIDELNILQATVSGMNRVVENVKASGTTPDLLLIDGPYFRNNSGIRHHCIPSGDSSYLSIAAASILAKTERDAYMDTLHKEFPMYGWERNKAYGTAEHREAIKTHGLTKYHRKSFRCVR